MIVHAAADPEGVVVAQLWGEHLLGGALEADGPGPALDGGGADGGGVLGAGGGEGAAVDHRLADLDARGHAVEDEPADAHLEDGLELAGRRGVVSAGEDRGGEAALDQRGGVVHLLLVGADDGDGGGAEDLFVQLAVVAEAFKVGPEDRGRGEDRARPAGRVCALGRAAAEIDALGPGEDGQAFVELGADAVAEHGARVGAIHALGERAEEGFALVAALHEQQAGAGAHLAVAVDDAGVDPAREGCGVLAEGLGQEEDGIDRAHLGEDGDRIGALAGYVLDRHAALDAAGEPHGSDEPAADEFLADRLLAAAAGVDVAEGAGVEADVLDGFGDRPGGELAGAGVGGVALDDDGAPGGEGARGVAAGGRVGQGEVAGAEDRDGTERAEHAADVGLGDGAAAGLPAVDDRADPVAVARDAGEHAEGGGGAFTLGHDADGRETGLGGGEIDEVGAELVDVLRDAFEQGGVVGVGCGLVERFPGFLAGAVDRGGRSRFVLGIELLARGGLGGAEGVGQARVLGVLGDRAGDDGEAAGLGRQLRGRLGRRIGSRLRGRLGLRVGSACGVVRLIDRHEALSVVRGCVRIPRSSVRRGPEVAGVGQAGPNRAGCSGTGLV